MDDFAVRSVDPAYHSSSVSHLPFVVERHLSCKDVIASERLAWKNLSTEDLKDASEDELEETAAVKISPVSSSSSSSNDTPSNMGPVSATEGGAAHSNEGVAKTNESVAKTNESVGSTSASRPGVSFVDVAKAVRASSLTEEEYVEGELLSIFDYDCVQLCYGDDKSSRPRASSNVRARLLWQRAIAKTRIMKDPWEKFNLEAMPAETVLRHRYNAAFGSWVTDTVVVKMDTEPFGHGAMRECFRMKKISSFARPRTISTASTGSGGGRNDSISSDPDVDTAATNDPTLWSGSAKNYVAKRYIESVSRKVYFDDVKLQMDAKLWGEEFNKFHPPKPVDIFQMSVLEFHIRPDRPLYHLEHFIEGEYVKYNSNSGYINDKMLRRTPQAFSHFTFERSGHQLIVVDVQGVGDLYTDPQIHTVTGSDYGDGNLGTRGMALFFHSHACNRICRSLKLVPFDLSPIEQDDQKSFIASQKNCVTMLRGIETPILPPGGPIASPGRALKLSSTSDEGYFEFSHPGTRVRLDSSESSGTSERRDSEVSADKAKDRNRIRHESILVEEDEMAPSSNFLRPEILCHRGSSVAVEMPLLNQLRANQEKKDSESILGQIHLDLARYHDQGRFRDDMGLDDIEFPAILYHLEKAAECYQLDAIMALAAILLKFSPDTVTTEIPESIVLKFLNGGDACGRGIELLTSAASCGDRKAMIRLGIAFESGSGLDSSRQKSWKEANHWFEEAAKMEDCDEGGQFDSMCDMPLYELLSRRAAMLTTGGFGLEADPSSAGDLYSAAADAAVEAMKGRLANKFYMLAEEAWALVEE